MSSQVMRVAVAQLRGSEELPTADVLGRTGGEVRAAMRRAHELGARLVLFHEGALTYPHKRLVSRDPAVVAEADWTKVDWRALEAELEAARECAAELGMWVVVHGLHRLTAPNRPHNSLYVISDTGEIVTRYEKRLLSRTEVSFMYTPGSERIVFEVDGYTFGCAICVEVAFPEVFVDYARLGVDCVLLSTSQSDEYPLARRGSLPSQFDVDCRSDGGYRRRDRTIGHRRSERRVAHNVWRRCRRSRRRPQS